MPKNKPLPDTPSEQNRFQMKMVFTAGMGFFTDAYDLFIIGIVTSILAPIWHLSVTQLALLNGASLAAAAIGALAFGKLADIFGRKRLYGVEVAILFFGAILSAASPSFTWLMIARILVGLGIGGDYPSSAIVASEYSPQHRRGYLVLLVFAMQALGLMVGPLLASSLLALQIPDAYCWRILLGLGAIPAASVFFLRRQIDETPFFKINKSAPLEVSRVVSDLVGFKENMQPLRQQHLFSKKWLKYLMGTAGAWFLLDVAFYGNGISSVMILKSLQPHQDLLEHTLLSAMMFLVFAVPGYFLAAKYIDKIGRKVLQTLGFSVMALCYLLLSLLPNIGAHLVTFIAIFGISFFFVNFGPNTTTFLVPSEIYPTSIRGQAHGFSAAIGKVGAFVGAFVMPIFLTHFGLSKTFSILAVVCIAGVACSRFIPEMAGKHLLDNEELDTLNSCP